MMLHYVLLSFRAQKMFHKSVLSEEFVTKHVLLNLQLNRPICQSFTNRSGNVNLLDAFKLRLLL